MQVADELRHAAIDLNQTVGELHRVRGGEADAVNTVNGGDILNQQRQIGGAAVKQRAAIGIDVLAEQIHLAHTLCGERSTFGNHIIKRAADLLAARIRHHAEGAILGAAFHDGNKSGRPLGARLRQMVKLLDFRERHLEHGEHLGRVVLVHLAAMRFNINVFQ